MSATIDAVKAHETPASETAADKAFVPLEIAAERCKGCGLCIATCPKHVLALDGWS